MLANILREYNVNRILLSSIGLWPFQNKLVRNFLQIFFLLLQICYLPFEVLLVYDHWDDSQMVFEGCYQTSMLLAFAARMINGIWNRDKFRQLYINIDEHWDIFTSDTEVRILKGYSILSRKFTKYHLMLMCSITTGFILIPLLTSTLLDIVLPLNESRPRVLAVAVEFRVDPNEYFLPIFFYTTVTMAVGVHIMVSVDTMHIVCIAHACSLFAAISNQIENIISKANNNNENKCGYYLNVVLDSSSEEMIYQEYIICLKKHQLAIKFVNILESTYQGISLFILTMFVILLSVIGIRIVYVLNQLEEMIKFLCIIMGLLMTLMILCYSGQKLMDESQDIFHRAYAAEWYKFSPRLKFLLIITLFRSKIPCGLKAGNMVPLSIATYAAVVRMSMSYFTAFLSLKE